MAFQITDDVLDLTATTERLGKPIGSDVQTGKVTLPIIHALAHAPSADQTRLREILASANGDPDGVQTREVQDILARCGAIDHALGVAHARAGRAAAALAPISGSPARESLLGLVEFVTVRRQ
jgi:octaprenyl-diphosphate synthase